MGLKKYTRRRLGLMLLAAISLLLVALAWPREDILLSQIGIDRPLQIRRGLDLQGGARLVYEAQMQQVQIEDEASAREVLGNAASVIERRVNPGGTAETEVRTAAGSRIVVELPGIEDPEEAKEMIGRTAQLVFLEIPPADEENELSQSFLPTDISGEDVRRATVDFAQATGGQPIVNLELRGGESTEKFAELTTRVSQTGGQLVTLLDEQVVFGPANVQQPITDGRAQLTGGFDIREAREIAQLLNAGALPVPVELVAQQTIGPTLGAESLRQSVLAAIIGLIGVAIFLIVYYRWAGVLSLASLLFYGLLLIVIFKLSALTTYALVLTLAGVAGFILSITVAVDANILVFERMREELKRGAAAVIAFEDGFKHAWVSIRDANVATLISTVILYMFGTPVIRGFAVTLGIGVLVNLLVVQTVTKTLMRWAVRSPLGKRGRWVGQNSKEAAE